MKKELVSKINVYIADLGVMFVKLHNLHWNVVGSNFKPVHEYLEGLYDSVATTLDDVAELLKKNEEYPLASLKDYLSNCTITEISSNRISTKEAIEIVRTDYKTLDNEALEIRNMADEAGEFLTVALFEGLLDEYSKTLWFLRAMEN